ncbi:MAG: hypothetical protein AAFX65_11445 [Cyanobacteria bacterium J06638_7]
MVWRLTPRKGIRKASRPWIRQYGVSEFGLLASDLLDVVDHPEAEGLCLPSLRRMIASGDTVPLELQRFPALFGGTVLEGCWMTEVGGYSAMQPVHGVRKPGAIIASAEIEELLDAHPAVHAAVVVGVPARRHGDVPVAWWQPQAGMAEDQDLHVDLTRQLAAYKLPVRDLPIAEMPRDSAGKFDRAALGEQARSLLNQPESGPCSKGAAAGN